MFAGLNGFSDLFCTNFMHKYWLDFRVIHNMKMTSRQFGLLVQALKRENSLCVSYVVQFSNLQHLLSDTRRETRSQDLKVMTSICVQIVEWLVRPWGSIAITRGKWNVYVEITFWLWKVLLHLFYNSSLQICEPNTYPLCSKQ